MKILLNGLSAVYPCSGVAQYTIQLGRSLGALLGYENIFWFGKNLSNHSLELHNTDPTFINRLRHNLKRRLRQLPRLNDLVYVWRSNQFRSYAQSIKPSLYHETKYVPFHFHEGPTIITLYDLSFMRHPEWHPVDRVKSYEKYCLKQLPNVDAIITISEFSKKEIIDLLGIHPSKIYVTPLGVSREFTPEGPHIKGLPNGYILFLGNLEPRKNLVTLLTAYRSLPRDLREKFPLVIAGAPGWHVDELEKPLRLFPKGQRPILTGYISQWLLPDLYRGSSLFVYPSLYEGFGLPVIEAMASGVPVLASDTASLPDIIGDAGIVLNPYDSYKWRETMIHLLENKKRRREMVERGTERAKLFSWEKCARGTLEIYKQVLSEAALFSLECT